MAVRPVRAGRSAVVSATRAVLAAVLASTPILVSEPASAAVTVRKGSANLTLPCGSNSGTTVSADWYFPVTASFAGVVWLQHGFSLTKTSVAALAESVAANTGAVVVAPTISSAFLSGSGCWINGLPMHQAVARLFGDRFANLQASANSAATAAAAGTVTLPRGFVLAGHSAGGNLATSAGGFTTLLTSNGALVSDQLRGVVMFDGVDNGGAIGTGVDRLSGSNYRPVWTIAAPDSSCNASGSGTKLLKSKRPTEFVGVNLVNGNHMDATASSNRACGTPRTENVSAVRGLAASWISSLLAGTPSTALLATTLSGTSTSVGAATATTL